MTFKFILTIVSAILGFAAAAAWVRSATVVVFAPKDVGRGVVLGGAVYDDDKRSRRFDVLATLRAQSSWNAAAAWLAAFAAALQTFTALLG